MVRVSAGPETVSRDEWFERIVIHSGVWVHEVCYNSDELMKVRQGRRSPRVAVRFEKPDASAILVRVPRKKTILSVPAVSAAALRTSKEDS